MFGFGRKSSPVLVALEKAILSRVGAAGDYKVIRNGSIEDVSDTYRVHRRLDASGWAQILAANPLTKEVYHVYCETAADAAAIRDVLNRLGIPVQVDLSPKPLERLDLHRIKRARGTARMQEVEKQRAKK